MELLTPSLEHASSYLAALEAGWSPDTTRPEVAVEDARRLVADPAVFVASMFDVEAAGPPVLLPDGSTSERLPGFRLWMWDGEFCGSIGLRWKPGTA